MLFLWYLLPLLPPPSLPPPSSPLLPPTASSERPDTGGSSSSDDTTITVGVVAAIFLVLIIVIVLVLIGVIYMCNSKSQKGKMSISRSSSEHDVVSAIETPDFQNADTPDLAKRESAYEMKSFEEPHLHSCVPSGPTSVADFPSHVEKFDANRQLLFLEEFEVKHPLALSLPVLVMYSLSSLLPPPSLPPSLSLSLPPPSPLSPSLPPHSGSPRSLLGIRLRRATTLPTMKRTDTVTSPPVSRFSHLTLSLLTFPGQFHELGGARQTLMPLNKAHT